MRRLLLVLAACSRAAAPAGPAPAPVQAIPEPDPPISTIDLTQRWADGCFVYRDAAGVTHANDAKRCAVPLRPYSTFKIANALIAVDAGVLDGPDASMTWDQQKIKAQPHWSETWRKPQLTLRAAMAASAVPHFRTLALTLGEQRMRAGLAKLDYGNQDISGGLDVFWLSGGIRISADQQLVLVEKLAHGTLAVSAKAQATVREVIELARSGDAILYGKTGTGDRSDGKGWLAWQVGWVQRGTTITPYAAWIELPDGELDEVRATREQRLRALLDELELFPKS